MQKKFLSVILAGAALTVGVRAQGSAPAPSAPPVPAPVAETPAASAQSQVAGSPASLQAPPPSQVIFAPRLPSPGELTQVAAAQGLTVEQINQTANQVTVVTRNNAGQLNSIAYQLLSTAGAVSASVAVATPAPVVYSQPAPVVYAQPTTVVTQPTTTVIYEQSPRTVYYDRYDPWYYPRYYSPPVSLSFGFGYSSWGGGHHHYRGHHHRGHHGHRSHRW